MYAAWAGVDTNGIVSSADSATGEYVWPKSADTLHNAGEGSEAERHAGLQL